MAALERKQIRPALKTALEAHAYFAAKAVKAVVDNGSKAASEEIETQLNGDGKPGVVLVLPPLPLTVKAQTGPGNTPIAGGLRHKAVGFVRIEVNRQRNTGGATGAAGFDEDELCDKIMLALLALAVANTLPGLEVGLPAPEGITSEWAKEPGLTSYDVWFSVPLVLRVPS